MGENYFYWFLLHDSPNQKTPGFQIIELHDLQFDWTDSSSQDQAYISLLFYVSFPLVSLPASASVVLESCVANAEHNREICVNSYRARGSHV